MLEIYVLTGSDIYYQVLNAVAALFNANGWSILVKWSFMVAILVGVVRFIGSHDLFKLGKWVLIYVFLLAVCIIPTRSVQIIDLSDRTVTYKVDNVPIGLAILFSYGTKIGYGIAEEYDTFFSVPDSMAYSKTGFLFGQTLARDSLVISNQNPDLNSNFNGYVSNCVLGDILLNNKYSMDELLRSTDLLNLITSNPSPIRHVFFIDAGKQENISCKKAAVKLNTMFNEEFKKNNFNFIGALSKAMYSQRPERDQVLNTLLQDSYTYFYNSSRTTVDILKQNVTIRAIQNGISNYAGRQGDVAGVVSASSENALMKSRLNWAISSKIATTYLPLLHTVLTLLLLGMLPIVLFLTFTDVMGVKPIQLYALSFVYFMSWIPLYSLLHYIMTFYTKSSLAGVDVNLSNINKLESIHSDIGMIAGGLSLSIPFLALGIVKGFASVVTHASNFVGSGITSASSQVSSSAADGNWNIGNVSTENVQGFKWDTNRTHSNGMSSTQLDNGAIRNIAQDGTLGYNTGPIQSNIATRGSYSDNSTAQYGESIRIAKNKAVSSLKSLNESSRTLLNNLTQLGENVSHGSSVSNSQGRDSSADFKKDYSEFMGTVDSFAKNNNVSRGEAFSYLNYISSLSESAIGANIGLGTPAGYIIQAGISASQKFSFSTGSTDNITDSAARNTSSSNNSLADYAKRFNEGISKISNYKATINGSDVSNATDSLLKNISSSREDSIGSARSYNESSAIAENLSKDLNYVQSNSSTLTTNLNNEFVKWFSANNPNSTDILSNTADSDNARKLEQGWQEFMGKNIDSRIQGVVDSTTKELKNSYQQDSTQFTQQNTRGYDTLNHEDMSNNMESVANYNGVDKDKVLKQREEIKDATTTNIDKNSVTLNNIEKRLNNDYDKKEQNYRDENKKFDEIKDESRDNQSFVDSNPISDKRKENGGK